MPHSLVQFCSPIGARSVALLDEFGARKLRGVRTTRELAIKTIASGKTLLEAAEERAFQQPLDLTTMTLLPAIDHPDTAHLVVAGTGLTHLGSAESRDRMHGGGGGDGDAPPTDSMRMFRMGLEGGKPGPGAVGAQPEWFYKGDGSILVGPDDALTSPAFALDAGEEPEIAGIYMIDPAGDPVRLGFALGNEFSDHITERGNYLWLAHSKLRQAAIGAELRLGALPASVRGTSRIRRGEAILWEKPFLSGEANMSHSLQNLEHHHFKYDLFRRAGDVHVHYFGTATASFGDGISTQAGDVFEIEADAFALPLRNRLAVAPDAAHRVRAL